jgi:hypothetical protein
MADMVPRMTAAERQELGKLVRANARVAKDDIDARGKSLLADAESKLAARYKVEDAAWKDITAEANRMVEEADARIAAICRERGVPEEFRPGLLLSWYGRGENAVSARRAELRKVAQAEVAARVATAKVEIDRQSAALMTSIARDGLTSETALALVAALPRPEDLLPPLVALPLANGHVVALEAPVTDEAVTDESGPVTAVTDEGGAVTDSRNRCAYCGGSVQGRSDARFCCPRCRVADHRRRQAVARLNGGQPPASEGGA